MVQIYFFRCLYMMKMATDLIKVFLYKQNMMIISILMN
ncbi:hypothetical protein GXY_03153 [Novacetimonas hansenii ATCC 23769]|uniref:Uncharacterized protein n=1 Tax=Novacetimonas hansenii ATCC 23769 TaxID=714995 RepID=D5QBY4_NOVHA|nr:hypothetical protein GXY_03153 [Novacetimonas hansenii ATCC 23769]